jgi:hypothetical protein
MHSNRDLESHVSGDRLYCNSELWIEIRIPSLSTLPLALPFSSPSFFHTISLSPAFTSA